VEISLTPTKTVELLTLP